MKRAVILTATSAVLIVGAVTSYIATQRLKGGSAREFVAAQTTAATGAAPRPTTDPGGRPPLTPVATLASGLPVHPNISVPNWNRAYLEDDERKPRTKQQISGISVGFPANAYPGSICVRGTAKDANIEDARGTPLDIQAKFLPEDIRDFRTNAVRCQTDSGLNELVFTQLRFFVEPDTRPGRLRLGGVVEITKWKGEPEVGLNIPNDRWSAGSILGQPSALGQPILPNGLGESAIITYQSGILTLIRSDSALTFADVIAIMEGLK
ncbi:MAG: hypothetical protein HYX51_06130 [Chloroflexi bacterium]|nr:hypothetical protein [Chloroflexota bacterium]